MIARWLHPGAWWLWSLSLAAAASQTTNPLLLALLIGSAVIVVASRKPQAPWGKSFNFFLFRNNGGGEQYVDAHSEGADPHRRVADGQA